MSANSSPKTAAIIYNSDLPDPLGGLGEYIASEVAHVMSKIDPVLVDLKQFVQRLHPHEPHQFNDGFPENTIQYGHQAFRKMMSQHACYFFVFPGHIWSHTRLFKHFVVHLPRHVYAHKPAALVTYTREDTRLWFHKKSNLSYEHVPRNSAPMMAEFLSQLVASEDSDPDSLMNSRPTAPPSRMGRRQGFNLVEMPSGYDGPQFWPEYVFFWDIWDDFPSSSPIWPGGNQVEAWESSGWGKCIVVETIMIDMLEGK